ncbi:MAG: hypothetical protein ACREDR_33035, partial [Blastocatellia bacterium]
VTLSFFNSSFTLPAVSTFTDTPSQATIYTLTANGNCGKATQTLSVTVTPGGGGGGGTTSPITWCQTDSLQQTVAVAVDTNGVSSIQGNSRLFIGSKPLDCGSFVTGAVVTPRPAPQPVLTTTANGQPFTTGVIIANVTVDPVGGTVDIVWTTTNAFPDPVTWGSSLGISVDFTMLTANPGCSSVWQYSAVPILGGGKSSCP